MIGEIGGTPKKMLRLGCRQLQQAYCRFRCRSNSTSGKENGARRCDYLRWKGHGGEKFSAFEKAGIHIARDPSKIGEVLVSVLIEAGLREP